MRYTQKYLEENTDVNEVWSAVLKGIATGAKVIGGALLNKGKEAAEAGFKPTRATHATFGGVKDPNERRGREVTDRVVSKLTGRKRSSGDGDSSENQSTPTKADTETEKYTNTEKAFKDRRKDLTKFPKVT